MTSTQERLLRAYAAVHGDIDDHDDYVGFGVWHAGRATPEGEVEYKHLLELAQVWQDRYVEGTAMATMSATRSCWIPWVMRRSCCRTSTWTTAPPWTAGQGACAGVTPGSGDHEDSLPRRARWPADRSPSTQETHGLDDGQPAFQGATEGQVARCTRRWESLSDR